MPAVQRVVQVCLYLVAAMSIFGGALQMSFGQLDAMPRLDNVLRFMAGVYLGTGIIACWAASAIRMQGTLVHLRALAVPSRSRWLVKCLLLRSLSGRG